MINNIKVLIIGDSYSGKTTLIKKIIGQPIKNINITLGIDFFQKKSKDTLIQMYDAGGNDQIFKIISTYLKNVDLIILTYDLNNNNNFKSICKWLDIIKIYSKPILLIGNKKELKNYTPKIPKTILDTMEIIPVKNVDEVLKVALTKPLKRVEWVEVENLSKTGKDDKSSASIQ